MWLYFDKNGRLIKSLEHGNQARAGSTDFQIFAVFEGDDYPSAYIKLFKPDYNHEAYPALPMEVSKSLVFVKDANEGDTYPFANGTTYTGYYFDFAHDVNGGLRSTILLDTAGLWSASIELHSAGSVHNVVGQATFDVGFGFEDEDGNEITTEEYIEELIALMDTKMNIKGSDIIRFVPNIATHGEWAEDTYMVGDIIFDKETHKLYKLTGLDADDYEPFEMPYVKKTGDSMSGDLNMSGNKVTGLANPVNDGDAVNKKYFFDNTTVDYETILTFDNKSDIVTSNYENGQMFFVRNERNIYKLVGSVLTISFRGVLTYSTWPNAAECEVGQTIWILNNTTSKLYEVVLENGLKTWKERFNFKNTVTEEDLEDYVTQDEFGEVKETVDDIPSIYETQEHATQTYETKTDAESKRSNLQSQIDAFESKTDVVDIVETYDRGTDTSKTDIVHYNTSTLGDNDVIKVLKDNNPNVVGEPISYYRYNKTSNTFALVGSIGPYYTVGQANDTFVSKVGAEQIYQHKVIYSATEPTEAVDGDLWAYEGIDLNDIIVGDGLTVVTENNTKTLKVDNTIARKDDTKLYVHNISINTGEMVGGDILMFTVLSKYPNQITVDNFNEIIKKQYVAGVCNPESSNVPVPATVETILYGTNTKTIRYTAYTTTIAIQVVQIISLEDDVNEL